MKSIDYHQKKYDELAEFLTECDNIPQAKWNMERWEAFAHAIAQYELLHDLLDLPGTPYWCT